MKFDSLEREAYEFISHISKDARTAICGAPTTRYVDDWELRKCKECEKCKTLRETT